MVDCYVQYTLVPYMNAALWIASTYGIACHFGAGGGSRPVLTA
jgi:hypothetical protein